MRTEQFTRREFSTRLAALAAFGVLPRAAGGAHLATGWHEHYWEPLKKYLA